MRNFILAGNKAYGAGFKSTIDTLEDQAVGFFYNDNGELKLASSDEILTKGEGNLILGRETDRLSPVVLPIFPHHFTYVKAVYDAGTTFEGKITMREVTHFGTYSVMIVKKGKKFNERNKWTASVYCIELISAAELATKLAAQINLNTAGTKITATVSGNDIVLKGTIEGMDYNIIGCDGCTGCEVTITTIGSKAFADAKYIKDLADKAAADAGFEYTYKEASWYLYPKHPLNPLAGEKTEDKGYTIFTLRFNEPRRVKTRDEVVNQIIQVAFPTGASAISDFEKVCEAMMP